MTEGSVSLFSALCIFFFFSLMLVGPAVGLVVFLEVVSSYTGEGSVCMGLGIAIKWYLHRGKRKQESSISSKTRVVSC